MFTGEVVVFEVEVEVAAAFVWVAFLGAAFFAAGFFGVVLFLVDGFFVVAFIGSISFYDSLLVVMVDCPLPSPQACEFYS